MAAGGSDDDPSQRARLLAQAISEGINLLALLGSEAPFPSQAPWDGSDPPALRRLVLETVDTVTGAFTAPPAGARVSANGFDLTAFVAAAERVRKGVEAWDGRLPAPESLRADVRAVFVTFAVPLPA
jgi:hypothetical protein